MLGKRKASASSSTKAKAKTAAPRGAQRGATAKVNGKRAALAEELDSGGSSDEDETPTTSVDADPEASETADERRVRLAKELLAGMDAAVQASRGDYDGDEDAVAEQLEEDALRASGQWRAQVADGLRGVTIAPDAVRMMRGPRLSATCVALTADESTSYCGSKDGGITRWDLASGARTKLDTSGAGGGGKRDVLAVACSPDGRLLASAGRRQSVVLWDTRTMAVVKELRAHRDAVTALTVRRGGVDDGADAELFSASGDRCVKLWSLQQRAYIETLFGHQEGITALDSLQQDVVLSAGVDRTVRLWKVADESHMVFRGHTAPIDCVAQLNAESFVSGSQDGTLALWSSLRKKPLAQAAAAHGEARWGGACWMSALTSLPFSDLAISGSCDGQLRFWQ